MQQNQDMKEIKEMLREIIDLLKEKESTRKQLEDKGNNFSQNTIEEYVTDYLYYLGIKTQYKGFELLRQAIIIKLQDPQKYEYLTDIYMKVAEIDKSTVSKVERCIRTVIERTYQKSTGKYKKIWENMFGSSIAVKGKVINSEFISRAVIEISSHLSHN